MDGSTVFATVEVPDEIMERVWGGEKCPVLELLILNVTNACVCCDVPSNATCRPYPASICPNAEVQVDVGVSSGSPAFIAFTFNLATIIHCQRSLVDNKPLYCRCNQHGMSDHIKH